jgi:RHS repeat-associated protein
MASYTYDGLDRPVSMWRGGSTHFFMLDRLGSVLGLMDGSGATVATYRYDPWGNLLAETGSVGQPFRFTGREWDAESGLYFYRMRYYDPKVGRFISRDPLGIESGEANPYVYALNNPPNWIDPLGLAVDAPGTWESLIPVWGSGKQAIHDFQCGNWGWGLFNSAMAVSDLFLLKSLATAAGKGLWKTGSHTWSATSKWLTKTGWRETPGQHMHHWLLHRNEGIGKYAPNWLKNQPWNLMPMDSATHTAVHGGGPNAYGPWGKFWNGTPGWAKAAGASAGGRGANGARGEGCDCD